MWWTPESNTVVDVRTVMVKLGNTTVTDPAVLRSQWPVRRKCFNRLENALEKGRESQFNFQSNQFQIKPDRTTSVAKPENVGTGVIRGVRCNEGN